MPENRSDCDVRQAGKRRDGKPRFWCHKHQASATGKYGIKLERCEGAYRSLDSQAAIKLNPSDYSGGVALWGAVKPAYDSTGLIEREGIHVHARIAEAEEKSIDETYDAVELQLPANLFDTKSIFVTRDTAVSAYISRCIGNPLVSLFCTYCGEPHLDSEWFAVKPHKRHLCHACGEVFLADSRGVSNPLDRLRWYLKDTDKDRAIIRPSRPLIASLSDFPGGVQMWASNPALLWTAPRPEEEGIHLHGYAADRKFRIADDTFSSVTLSGITVDETQLRYYMAQSALAHLQGRIVSLKCRCGTDFFDKGLSAFMPHDKRVCEECGAEVKHSGSKKKVVSNPFLTTITLLNNARGLQ